MDETNPIYMTVRGREDVAIDLGQPSQETLEKSEKPTFKSVLWSLDSASILVTLAIWVALIVLFPPFERPFDINDTSLQHPNVPDIVRVSWVVIAGAILPVIIVVPVTRNALWTLIVVQRYLLGAAVTGAITEFFKRAAGRLRPDFLDRCKPSNGVCTGDAAIVTEGRLSFFSGHASMSFYIVGFFVFWMWAQGWQILGIRVGRKITPGYIITLSLLALLLPSYVAVSRTQQYIHHVSDVAVGTIFGLFMSLVIVLTHRQKSGM